MSSDEGDFEYFGQRSSAVCYDQAMYVSPRVNEETLIRTEDRRRNEPKIGECYIFNYQKFVGQSSRPGSEKDVESLKHDFDKLNFNVHDYQDLTKKLTSDALEEAAKSGRKDHKCFVCCFLSHGNLRELRMKDVTLEINEILRCFSRSNCGNLEGVPKIFIFQACRGKCREDGTPCCEKNAPSDRTDYDSILELPDFLDFLLVYSTYDGKVAHRFEKHGSIFINELCRSIEQFSNKLDLLQILTIVNYRLAHFFVNEKDNTKQMPYFTSSLRTKVEFNKDIMPHESEGTKFFDSLRSKSVLGLQSTNEPLLDKKTYKIQECRNIKFLFLLNTENNFQSCLLQYASTLWSSVTQRGYQSETLPNWSEEELMHFLEEVSVRDSANRDCLICFIACSAREDHLCDRKGKNFHMRKIVEQFTGKFVGKPKIFIFLMSSPTSQTDVSTDSTDSECYNLIPVHSDLLEVIITIQNSDQLKAVMEKFSHIFGEESSEDFLSQLTKMNEEFVKDYGFHSVSGQNLATFSFNSTLTKTLIINKN